MSLTSTWDPGMRNIPCCWRPVDRWKHHSHTPADPSVYYFIYNVYKSVDETRLCPNNMSNKKWSSYSGASQTINHWVKEKRAHKEISSSIIYFSMTAMQTQQRTYRFKSIITQHWKVIMSNVWHQKYAFAFLIHFISKRAFCMMRGDKEGSKAEKIKRFCLITQLINTLRERQSSTESV